MYYTTSVLVNTAALITTYCVRPMSYSKRYLIERWDNDEIQLYIGWQKKLYIIIYKKKSERINQTKLKGSSLFYYLHINTSI